MALCVSLHFGPTCHPLSFSPLLCLLPAHTHNHAGILSNIYESLGVVAASFSLGLSDYTLTTSPPIFYISAYSFEQVRQARVAVPLVRGLLQGDTMPASAVPPSLHSDACALIFIMSLTAA